MAAPEPHLAPAFTFPVSPQVRVDQHEDGVSGSDDRPPLLNHHLSEPIRRYASPMRHHKRTPSAHHEVKETLDAHTEFGSEDADGKTHHRVNQYTILEEIGRGSYGAVHLAVDQFGKEYAIKEFSKTRLRRRAQSDILRQGPRGPGPRPFAPRIGSAAAQHRAAEAKDALYLVRQEMAIMKKLCHQNLVQLFEVLDDPEEDSVYMVLEMCKKGVIMKVDLDDPAEPYDEENCRCWFRDLILGIEYLHAQGVIHRDIKPDNLLLSEDNVLKIVDFGVSEMFEKHDKMWTAKSAGSPAFLPPELCGKHSDVSGTAADIWSMGVSLYCLKYGRLPFNRDGLMDMYEAIKCDEPQIPENGNPDLVDLLHKLLEKDPGKRITMKQLREHPWVTCNGNDPLLSSDDNCVHMVDPPNELEVSRALTRKMNHLLCVMKAIRKFKAVLIKKRAGSSNTTPLETPNQDSRTTVSPLEAKEKAVDIEALLAQRRQAQERNLIGDGLKGHARDASTLEPLFLGIGTGARDDFAMDQAATEMVSDSPTAVDFNVYDQAYENAVKDITSASHKPTLYLTRFVQEKDHFKKIDEIADASGAPTPLINPQHAPLAMPVPRSSLTQGVSEMELSSGQQGQPQA